MKISNPQNICNHQLIFTSSLDHAACCARCGAIALIEHKDGEAHIKWISTAHDKPSDGAKHSPNAFGGD